MEFWQMLLVQVLVTASVVLVIITIFYQYYLKPFLNKKVAELIEAASEIEPKVRQGVQQGVSDSLKVIPEATAKESTRQFLRFGSDLFENGLASFLGTAEDLARRSTNASGRTSNSDDPKN